MSVQAKCKEKLPGSCDLWPMLKLEQDRNLGLICTNKHLNKENIEQVGNAQMLNNVAA